MTNQSVKKSLEKSKNVLEEKRKIVKRKICIKKTHTFTIIAMNCVQEQLKSRFEVIVTSYGRNKNLDKNKRGPIIASAIASRLLIKHSRQIAGK